MQQKHQNSEHLGYPDSRITRIWTTAHEEQIEAQREILVKREQEQRLDTTSQNKQLRNTDRPLSSIRPIAGRTPQMQAKGRFSKFSF